MTRGFTKGSKCGCFIFINILIVEVNPPYGKSGSHGLNEPHLKPYTMTGLVLQTL